MKSSEGERASQSMIDLNNLNTNTKRRHAQDIRLRNMERLCRDCDDQKQAMSNSERTIERAQDEFASLGLVTDDLFVSYVKDVVKPGLEHANKRFIDVEVENTGRGEFSINKGLQATKKITGTTTFNPEVITTMDRDQMTSYLKYLLYFHFVIKEMVNDAILECDLVFNYTK